MAKRDGKSKAGIVVLALLLILAGGVGFLYYSIVKAPLKLDDPTAMAASAPMAPAERFSFDAAGQSARVKLDAADLWCLILNHTGGEFLDPVNGELESYGVQVKGCAIRIEESGLTMDLELSFRETRLVAKVPCNLEVREQSICLSPAGVKLGVIPLPVKGLLSNIKLEYDLTLPVLSQVTDVAFEEGAIVLTGPMQEDLYQLIPRSRNLYGFAVFSGEWKTLADALQTEEGFAALLTRLEGAPGEVEQLYRELFTLADSKTGAEYLEERHGLTERFFPGIDFEAVEEARAAVKAQLDPMVRSLEQFFTAVVGDYNDKKFRLSEGEFLKYGKPFKASGYGGETYKDLFEVLNMEEFFLILVSTEDGYIRNTSSFYRICDEKQEFTKEVDFNRTYILGCVIHGVDGDSYVMYEAEVQNENTYSRNVHLVPLTEEEVEQLKIPGKFGVWTGK